VVKVQTNHFVTAPTGLQDSPADTFLL
jgi:hypothetical protein